MFYRLSKTASVTDVCDASYPSQHPVRLSRAVANYCDFSSYPSVEEVAAVVQSGHAVTVGIHPRHAASISDDRLAEFQALCANPAVTGVGEVGIDHTVNSSLWRCQHIVLDQALDVLEDRHVLVFHCRSPAGSDEVFYPLIFHLRGRVDRNQRIHLYCFQGGIRKGICVTGGNSSPTPTLGSRGQL